MAPSSTASSQESPLHAANADCNGGCTGADVDHARCTSPEEQRRTGEAASQADENTPGKPAAVGTACGKVDPGPGTATTAVESVAAESVAAESVAAESVAAESAPAEGAPDEGGADEGAPAEGGADEGAPAEGAPDEGGADEGAPDEGVADEGVPTEGVFAESETAGAENVRRGSEGARAGFPAEGWHNGGGLAAESTPAALSPDKRRRAGSEEEESQDLQQGRRDSQANCFRDDGDSHTAKKNKLSTDLSDPHSLAAPSGHETPREPDEEERTERGSTAGTSSPVAAVDIARQSGGDCSSPDRFVPRRRKKWDMGSPILLPKPRAESGPPRICSSIDDYKRVKFLGDGTFGSVYEAFHKTMGTRVALKEIKLEKERLGFPVTAVREIKILQSVAHPNVLPLLDMAVEQGRMAPNGELEIPSKFYMVLPYMDQDLLALMKRKDVRFSEPQVKAYMKQILLGCAHLHALGIMHRDIKTANILVSNEGNLKLADFGLARPGHTDPMHVYTGRVVTPWYRAPELCLGEKRYTYAIDVWSIGCVLGELLTGSAILPGETETDQIKVICDMVGTPSDELMARWRASLPGAAGLESLGPPKNSRISERFRSFGTEAVSLLTALLELDPYKRITAHDALDHPWFWTNPLPSPPDRLPKYPPAHDCDLRNARGL